MRKGERHIERYICSHTRNGKRQAEKTDKVKNNNINRNREGERWGEEKRQTERVIEIDI